MSAEKIKKYLQESQKDERWQESTQLREMVAEREESLDKSTKAIKENGKLVAKKDSNLVKNDMDSDEKVFNADFLDILARPPVDDVEIDYTAEEIARIKESVGEVTGDMIETMEKLRIACEKEIQGELERYVEAGGNPEDFEPQLIPYGIVYEAYMYDKKLKEKERLKQERSLKNRLKKRFASNTETESKIKTTNVANGNKSKMNNKTAEKTCARGNEANSYAKNNEGVENKTETSNNRVKNAVGNATVGSEDFKNNFQIDKNLASSANRIYEKKTSDWDEQRESREAILLKNHELRQLGIPFDETLERQVSQNLTFKMLSAMMVVSSIVAKDPQWTLALATSGISLFICTKYTECKADLKYRKAVDDVRKAFIRARGAMTEEDVQRILNTHKVKLPDEYALACMTQEERDEILDNAKNPKELSKRKLIKHIKRELTNFEVQRYEEMRKKQKTVAKEPNANSR